MTEPAESLPSRLEEVEVRASTIGIIKALSWRYSASEADIVQLAAISSEQAQHARYKNQEYAWVNGRERLPFPPPLPSDEHGEIGLLSVNLSQEAARILLTRFIELNLTSAEPVTLGAVIDEAVHYEQQVARADAAGVKLILVERPPDESPLNG